MYEHGLVGRPALRAADEGGDRSTNARDGTNTAWKFLDVYAWVRGSDRHSSVPLSGIGLRYQGVASRPTRISICAFLAWSVLVLLNLRVLGSTPNKPTAPGPMNTCGASRVTGSESSLPSLAA